LVSEIINRTPHQRSWDNLVDIVTRLQVGWLGFDSQLVQGFFFSLPLHPNQVWDPPSILSSGYERLFSWSVISTGGLY